MGGRITIDSATLINKGLELIEAHHLFGVPYERIDVVVHPQSIVHSLIELNDGAQLAHLGLPDMRVPISYALHSPRARRRHRAAARPRRRRPARASSRPDLETFPCLRLAREAGLGRGHRALRAERRRRGRRGRLPRRADRVHRDRRGRSRASSSEVEGEPLAPLRAAVRVRRAGPRALPPGWSSGRVPAHELGPRLPRLRRADHPATRPATSPPPRRSGCGSSASSCSSRRSSGASSAARPSTGSARSRSAAS